jgi:hypothetical protein
MKRYKFLDTLTAVGIALALFALFMVEFDLITK